MKSLKKDVLTLLLTAGAISSGAAVSAQLPPGTALPPIICRPGIERADDIRRVPLAATETDTVGAKVYIINGRDSWRRTDVEVKRGQKIEISASGVVRWAPDGIEKIDVTTDGTRPPYRSGWNYLNFPFPEAGIGSLVMRIGKAVYAAGSALTIESEDDGIIEFMVNDDILEDNSGAFRVKITLPPM